MKDKANITIESIARRDYDETRRETILHCRSIRYEPIQLRFSPQNQRAFMLTKRDSNGRPRS